PLRRDQALGLRPRARPLRHGRVRQQAHVLRGRLIWPEPAGWFSAGISPRPRWSVETAVCAPLPRRSVVVSTLLQPVPSPPADTGPGFFGHRVCGSSEPRLSSRRSIASVASLTAERTDE